MWVLLTCNTEVFDMAHFVSTVCRIVEVLQYAFFGIFGTDKVEFFALLDE